jgi:DNA polymerase-3 subunit gamma/tau
MRYLLSHNESDCIFECTSNKERRQHLDSGCDDVTGSVYFEQRFQLAKTEGKKMGEKVRQRATTTGRVSSSEVVKTNTPKAASDEPYHIKYRPKELGGVVGQDVVVKSLQGALKKATRPHAYLFTGQAGCGKTTLARILASQFNVSTENIIEADGATNTGIDAMREITATLRYQGFGETPNKMIIIDEAHMLSKNAWASLLKSVEEPPEHVFFAFCTTDGSKIPEAIRTRCGAYDLKAVRYDDILDLLEKVADSEHLKIPDAHLKQVAKACGGSPRQALVMLAMVEGCDDEDEVATVLESPLESKEIIDLCRLLISGKLDWKKVQETLKALSDQNPESIRIVMVNYTNGCLIGAKGEREVPRLLDILAAFSKPCNPSDKMAGVLLALGNLIFPA